MVIIVFCYSSVKSEKKVLKVSEKHALRVGQNNRSLPIIFGCLNKSQNRPFLLILENNFDTFKVQSILRKYVQFC